MLEIAGFIFFLAVFAGIGLWSNKKRSSAGNDYLLAGQTVNPLLTALSAAATKYSGYMFIGLIGYIYTYGISAICLICGFLFGDVIAYSFVHRHLRKATEDTKVSTFAELLSRWHSGSYRYLRIAVGILTLIFLCTYAGAQLNAGGKALYAIFGWPTVSGALIGAGLILVYCLFGGLRASIWTDAAQSILMMTAILLLLISAIVHVGGVTVFVEKLKLVEPGYLDPGVTRFGSIQATLLFAFGWLFNGIGVTGQPQVMIRFMALDKTEHIKKTGFLYFLWSGSFLLAILGVGLATRLYITQASGFDPELALPELSQILMPGLAVGVILGGVFAASMSTTDSQVLSCSAVLSEDFNLWKGANGKRISTLIITIGSLAIALFATASVFNLVIFAWTALACSIGPLVIIHALGARPREWLCFLMMLVGMTVAFSWRASGLGQQFYEGAPGILSALATFGVLRLILKDKAASPAKN